MDISGFDFMPVVGAELAYALVLNDLCTSIRRSDIIRE